MGLLRLLSTILALALSGCFLVEQPKVTGQQSGLRVNMSHAGLESSCMGCHQKDQPQTLINKMDHSKVAGMDCVSCHVSNIGVSWSGGVFGHNPVPTTCTSCHISQKPSAPVMGFDHSSIGTQDCATCHNKPGITWVTSGSFNHSPLPAACMTCHLDKRPSGVVQRFDHSYPAGQADCIGCHAGSAGLVWSGALFNHTPAPTTCLPCHTSNRPTAPIGGFDHSQGGSGDCVSCHKTPGVRWSGATFSHNPVPGTCISCHTNDRPTGLVGPTNNRFDHANAGMGDCKTCHTSNIGVNWTGGFYNHTPTPASCSTCHTPDRPTTTINGFNHSNGGMGDCKSCHTNVGVSWAGGIFSHNPVPATCATCHSAQRPTAVVNNFNHTQYGMGDCKSCHNNPGVSWAGGSFSHTPTPTTCSNCHTNSRPTGLVGPATNKFDHAVAGLGDCKTCHISTTAWSGGTFNHSPKPAACLGCHVPDRPSTVINGFTHLSGAGAGDCVSCHLSTSIWTGGSFSHTPAPASCTSCHTSDRPTGLVGPATGKFDHAVAGMGDCKTCHVANIGVNWTGGTFNHSPKPASCSTCHVPDRPTTTINGFNHSNGGTGDCVSCHLSTSTWSGGTFSHTPVPASCSTCHAGDRPTGLVGPVPNQFNHATYGTGDCKSCHTANIGVNWTGGNFSHSPKPGACISCHVADRPAGTVNGYNHSTMGGTGDCVSCHLSTSTWSGGNYVHPTGLTSCTSCHSSDRPANAIYPSPSQTVAGHYASPASTGSAKPGDCVNCHRAKSTTVTSFNWNHKNNSNVTASTCLPCHLQKGKNEHGNNVQDCKGCHNSTSNWD